MRKLKLFWFDEDKNVAKFKRGDLVKKKSGSEWQGIVCGEYSTELTPEGYAVESANHKGSVQIYPASALEFVDDNVKVYNYCNKRRCPTLIYDTLRYHKLNKLSNKWLGHCPT